ncbi:MAG: hypothetical protein GY802_13440 [Gammaproteobacteria bacterium]|nr:hypothetical protein [Gammaproteobacteria bacterium]
MPSIKFKIPILVALTLLAVGAYFTVNQFSSPVEQDLMSDFKASQFQTAPSDQQDSSVELAPVDVMLVGLKQRLEKQPGDVDGWVLLSKSYYHLKRWREAQEAFEKAKTMGYAGPWQPLPRIDAFSQNSSSSQNFAAAIEFRDYKSKQDASEAVAEAGSDGSAGLKLKVSLNPALRKEIPAASPVFVFVRAAQNPGPPLAVVRKKVDELPFEIALNDSHAMMPGRTISSAENIIVGVRISVSGSPERQPGDYEQLSDSMPANFSETIELVINDKI